MSNKQVPKYCTCKEPEPEVDVTMTEMYCEKCGKDIKKRGEL
jgi:hypothetical protein